MNVTLSRQVLQLKKQHGLGNSNLEMCLTARTSSESFILLEIKDENRTTDASMASRFVEIRVILELICPPKPKREGPPGMDNS